MKVTGSDLMKLLLMIKTLTIINNPTFWVAHDAYLSSRFQLLQILEKHTLLGPIVRQFEKSRTGLRVRVKAGIVSTVTRSSVEIKRNDGTTITAEPSDSLDNFKYFAERIQDCV